MISTGCKVFLIVVYIIGIVCTIAAYPLGVKTGKKWGFEKKIFLGRFGEKLLWLDIMGEFFSFFVMTAFILFIVTGKAVDVYYYFTGGSLS